MLKFVSYVLQVFSYESQLTQSKSYKVQNGNASGSGVHSENASDPSGPSFTTNWWITAALPDMPAEAQLRYQAYASGQKYHGILPMAPSTVMAEDVQNSRTPPSHWN